MHISVVKPWKIVSGGMPFAKQFHPKWFNLYHERAVSFSLRKARNHSAWVSTWESLEWME